MENGKLIVFEGISGTGKETQAKLLQKTLKTLYIADSHIVYHPTPALKLILQGWRKERHIDATTEVYLLLADRYDRVTKEIIPLLSKEIWVISLRNYVSALVYQGKTEENRKWIAREFSLFEPKPDILFYFHISPQDALLRIRKRSRETGEPLGKFETLDLLIKKIQAYKTVLADLPHISVDASQSVESIEKIIRSNLFPLESQRT